MPGSSGAASELVVTALAAARNVADCTPARPDRLRDNGITSELIEIPGGLVAPGTVVTPGNVIGVAATGAVAVGVTGS